MICSNCGTRFAPIEENQSQEEREFIFDNDEIGLCSPECTEENDYNFEEKMFYESMVEQCGHSSEDEYYRTVRNDLNNLI